MGWVRHVWNVGNSLIGCLGAVGGVWRVDHSEGVAEVAGGWLIGRLVRQGWASAITLGDVILYADARLIPLLHEHEMVHVRQGRAWGPLFLPAYVLESLYQQVRMGDGYRSNRFEVAAYGINDDVQETRNSPPN